MTRTNPLISRNRLRALSARLLEGPAVRLLHLMRVTPNMVSLAGLLLSCGAGYSIGTGQFYWGGGLVVLSGLMDLLDGSLARSTGKVSPLGGVVDSVFDRLGEGAIFLGLLVDSLDPLNELNAIFAFTAFGFGMLVSYLRARGEAAGLSVKDGVMTRPERLIAVFIGLIIGQMRVALLVIIALSLITVLQRSYKIWKGVRGV